MCLPALDDAGPLVTVAWHGYGPQYGCGHGLCHLFAVESTLVSAMAFSQEELSAPKPPTWLTGSLACPAFSGSHL